MSLASRTTLDASHSGARRDRTPELESIENLGVCVRRGPFRLRRLVAPGELLSEGTQRSLLEMITRESSIMFGGIDTAPYWDARPGYFDDLSEWWVADRDGCLAGWLGLSCWQAPEGRVIYIDTLGIMPGDRRVGLGALLALEMWFRLCARERQFSPMTMRIQSPVILRMILRFVPNLTFPRPGHEGRRKYEEMARWASSYTARRTSPGCEFDPSTGVVREAFGRKLYGGPVPRCGDPEVDGWFDRNLDYDAGDGLIAAVAYSPPAALAGASIAYMITRTRIWRSR